MTMTKDDRWLILIDQWWMNAWLQLSCLLQWAQFAVCSLQCVQGNAVCSFHNATMQCAVCPMHCRLQCVQCNALCSGRCVILQCVLGIAVCNVHTATHCNVSNARQLAVCPLKCSVQCAMCTLPKCSNPCAQGSVQCALYMVHDRQHSAVLDSKLCTQKFQLAFDSTVQYVVYNVQCANMQLRRGQCTLPIVHCTLHIAHCLLHVAHCRVYEEGPL